MWASEAFWLPAQLLVWQAASPALVTVSAMHNDNLVTLNPSA